MMPVLNIASCPNLAIPAQIMQRVVQVESDANPFAIGVVGGRLVRQPQNAGEAIATVRELEAQGYNFSVGLGQVNRANLRKYGLDSYETAFDPCANLQAASRILADCYRDANGDWGKAFSCYYSGDFVTGYRDGYVQRVYAALGQAMPSATAEATPRSLLAASTSNPVAPDPTPAVPTDQPPSRTVLLATLRPDSAAYRLALRSTLIDAATNLAISRMLPLKAPPPTDSALDIAPASATAKTAPPVAAKTPTIAQAPGPDSVFVPRVSGPNAPPVTAQAAPTTKPAAPADKSATAADAAFVF